MHVIMALVHLWPWMIFIAAGVALFWWLGIHATVTEKHKY